MSEVISFGGDGYNRAVDLVGSPAVWIILEKPWLLNHRRGGALPRSAEGPEL
jgi:hypothetical protein